MLQILTLDRLEAASKSDRQVDCLRTSWTLCPGVRLIFRSNLDRFCSAIDMGNRAENVYLVVCFLPPLLFTWICHSPLANALSTSRTDPSTIRAGSFMIVAAVEVHRGAPPGVNRPRCTELSPRGLQLYDVLGVAIDEINLKELGGTVLDFGCIETASSLIAGTESLARLFKSYRQGSKDAGLIYVDAAGTNASFAVAQLLTLYGLNVVNIPAVPTRRSLSARAAGSEKLLTETRPSFTFDVEIMADILDDLQIENVGLITIETTDGKAIRTAFSDALAGIALARKRDIRILSEPLSVNLPAFPNNAEISKAGTALSSPTPPGSVFVLLCPELVVRQIFAEARKRNTSTNSTLILALEKWSLKNLTESDIRRIGNIVSISFALPQSIPPPLQQRSVQASQLMNAPSEFVPTEYRKMRKALDNVSRTCTSELSFLKRKPFDQESYNVCLALAEKRLVFHPDAVFFYDAIMSLGRILRNMSTSNNILRFNIPTDPEKALTIVDKTIQKQLKTRTFSGFSRHVLDYRPRSDNKLHHGDYDINFLAIGASVKTKVGRWTKTREARRHSFKLDSAFLSRWRFTGQSCRIACQPGTYRNSERSTYLGGQCWVCERCSIGISKGANMEQCHPCPPSYAPTKTRDSCYLPELEYLHWTDAAAVAELFFAALGFILVCICLEVFRRHINTPIVRAASRELSVALLLDMALLLLAVPLQISKPSSGVCAARLVLNTLLFSFYMATLLVTSMRLWVLFRKPTTNFFSKRELGLLSNRSLLIYVIVLGVCGGFLGLVSVALGQTAADMQQPILTQRILQCKPSNVGFALPFTYCVILAIIAGLMAFLTRNLPLQYNETTFIIVTVSLSIFAWMVSGILGQQAVGKPGSEQLWSGSALLLTAYVAIFGQFAPKVRIILFYPERNIRRLGKAKNIESSKTMETAESAVTSGNFRLTVDEAVSASKCCDELCKCPYHNTSLVVPRHDRLSPIPMNGYELRSCKSQTSLADN